MMSAIAQILPALESLGVWSYWIMGLASLLEAWWITGLFVPGTLIVDAGGVLVRLGYLRFIDLAWFVALGAILGGELGWHSGRWMGGRLAGRQSAVLERARALIRRRGGAALVIGRFLGPVAGFVPLAAALAGMDRRRFVVWNVASGVIYALAHLALGYAIGDVGTRLGLYLPRFVLPLVLLLALVVLAWFTVRQVERGLPALLAGAEIIRSKVLAWPPLARGRTRLAQRFPNLARMVEARLDTRSGGGLLTTAVVVLVGYLGALFVDNALDLTLLPDTVALDQRVANLAHAYWSPDALRLAGWFTQAGHVPVATLVALAAVAGFLARGRRAAALGLAVAVVGDALTVTLLKLAFGRARPELSYFLETSHSFPSGHAAISVALYGTLALMLWRERLIGPAVAVVAAAVMAVGLGLTRIYLVEHFLSDVLNGWLVGTVWMVIGLALAEGRRQRDGAGGFWRVPGMLALVAALGGAVWFAVHDVKTPVERGAVPALVVGDPAAALGTADLPVEVVRLDGERLPPVSVLTVGYTLPEVQSALQAAGWHVVPEPGLSSVAAALRADLSGSPVAGATVPPAFRAAQPAVVTLRDTRSLLRIWRAGEDAQGRPLLALAVEGGSRDDDIRTALDGTAQEVGIAAGAQSRVLLIAR